MPDPEARSLSDPELAAAIGHLSEAALSEVYRRHVRAVYALALRILRDPTRAQETTQEVFVRLWRDPGKFDAARGSLRSYLLADAHGRSVDIVRQEVARGQREEKAARLATQESADVDRQAWGSEVAEQVQDALRQLPATERDAIELAYFGGLTYREVAQRLGEAEGTTKSRIRAGLRRMRAVLQTRGVEGSWLRT